MWQGRLHEEPQRKALYIYSSTVFCFFFTIHRFSCLHFLACTTSLDFSLSCLHHIFSFLLYCPERLSESPSLLSDKHRSRHVCTTPATTKQTLLLPCTQTSIYPDLDLPVIVQTDSQSKVHHTLGAKNKLNSVRPCIPFQNQYLSSQCVTLVFSKKKQARISVAVTIDFPPEGEETKKWFNYIFLSQNGRLSLLSSSNRSLETQK